MELEKNYEYSFGSSDNWRYKDEIISRLLKIRGEGKLDLTI
jgi:hypothetical protein